MNESKKIYSRVEYYSTMIKTEILAFALTWLTPDGIMPSEISQTEKDKCEI